MAIAMTDRIVRTGGLQTTNVDNDIVILNMKTNNYIALNDIGRRIWDLLEAPMLVRAVCQQLSGEFNAPAVQIEKDVMTFLNEMQTEGLVHVVGN